MSVLLYLRDLAGTQIRQVFLILVDCSYIPLVEFLGIGAENSSTALRLWSISSLDLKAPGVMARPAGIVYI